MTSSLFEHLLEINARLGGALDVSPGETPDVAVLSNLLDVRAALLCALQEAAKPAPAELRLLLVEQHHRLNGLMQTRSHEISEHLQRIERFEQAQARYAPATPRRVLRNGLNI